MHLRPLHIPAAQWSDACAKAHMICSDIAKNGGSARDAVKQFGLGTGSVPLAGWNRAEELIAELLCSRYRTKSD